MPQPLQILVLAPHPDDAEIGMGGTIAKLSAMGHRVLIADLTDGSPTPHGDRASRLIEAEAARRALCPSARMEGVGGAEAPFEVRRVLLDLPNRMVTHTLESRHKVAGVIRAHQASVVFMPHPEDAHPDHVAVTRIGEDARFDAKLTKVEMPVPPGYSEIGPPIYPKWCFYYYCSHLRSVPSPSFIVDTTGYAERKYESLRAYATQFAANPKNAGVLEWIQAEDRFFGSRIGTRAGEAFWTREPIGLSDFGSLVG